MASNITLSAAARSNLLSLQGTSDLIKQTQGRLSTGLRVGSPIDDAVAFFQAKSLNDRSADFAEKKDGIDQGISTLTTSLDAIKSLESVAKQMKGLAVNAKSATTSSQIAAVVDQFNDLRNQLNYIASDSSYQGLNLVNGTGQTLSVEFSVDTASQLSVRSRDLSTGVRGLNVDTLVAATTGIDVNVQAFSAGSLTAGGTITITFAEDVPAGSLTALTFKVGSVDATLTIGSSTSSTLLATAAYTAGQSITLTLGSTASAANTVGITGLGTGLASNNITITEKAGITNVGVGLTESINSMVRKLDSALTRLRNEAQGLGSNVALLQTRLDFTKSYVNTLGAGAGKLTLADLNEEGANLLALQTRQQLGIQALSFAGQSDQSVLSLFR